MKCVIVLISLIIIGLSLGPSKNHSLGEKKGCTNLRYKRLTERRCRRLANRISMTNVTKSDLDFFKTCITKYYCFVAREKDRWTTVPTFRRRDDWKRIREKRHFEKVAKRVELFFIRNNDWQRTVAAVRSSEGGGSCSQLLHVVAARYLYVVYVMRLLSDAFYFYPCQRNAQTYRAPTHGACFIPPTEITCYSDHEIKLLGGRSGTLTGLFNQFFREPVGKDPAVPGFGKSPEEIFGANVVAFQLEYAMPNYFVRESFGHGFVESLAAMRSDIKYQMLQIVVAIYKMRTSQEKYFHDFMSDHVQLRSKPNLVKIFQGWTVQLNLFGKKINSFVESPHYAQDLSFRRRNNIGYELVAGTVENAGIPWWRMLAEDAIALMHDSECYMTRGATRHTIGEVGMKLKQLQMSVNDYWLSMLENWAYANNKYKRECVGKNLEIQACLLKMSKYLWIMLEAMHKAREYLKPARLASALLDVDTNGLRRIVRSWEIDLRRRGVAEIPMPPRLTTAALTKLKTKRIDEIQLLPTSLRVGYPTTVSGRPRSIYSVSRRRRMYSVSRRRRMYSVSRRRRMYSVSRRRRMYSASRRRRTGARQGKKSPNTVQQFLTAFKCYQTRDIPLVVRMEERCMDAIHSEIRKYNRKLFLNKARSKQRWD